MKHSTDDVTRAVQEALPGWHVGAQDYPSTDVFGPNSTMAFLLRGPCDDMGCPLPGTIYVNGEGRDALEAYLSAMTRLIREQIPETPAEP